MSSKIGKPSFKSFLAMVARKERKSFKAVLADEIETMEAVQASDPVSFNDPGWSYPKYNQADL